MTKELFFQAVGKLTAGMAVMSLLLFLPAGTWCYPGGWRLLGLLFVPMVLLGAFLMGKNPELLRKRLKDKEPQAEQSLVIKLSGLMFLLGFVAAGLDFRFGWSSLPEWIPLAASAVFLLGYGMYARVMRENAFLSRIVEVQEGQTVVDTGLYGIVRHPMYSATVLLFLSMPLVLGSWVSGLCFLAYPAILVKRIRNEEALLAQELEGYTAYQEKVRWRLIPFIW